MLSKILDMDNIVFRFFRKLGYVWWLHILWLVCSLPVITIGASTTALCYSTMRMRYAEGNVTRDFFKSFKENIIQSTILFLIYLIAGVVIIFDLIICSQGTSAINVFVRYCAIALIIPYMSSLLYVFAIQAKYVNSVKNTIKYSAIIALKNIKWTFAMLIIIGTVLYLNTTIVLFNYLTISIGIGAIIYIFSWFYNIIFKQQ